MLPCGGQNLKCYTWTPLWTFVSKHTWDDQRSGYTRLAPFKVCQGPALFCRHNINRPCKFNCINNYYFCINSTKHYHIISWLHSLSVWEVFFTTVTKRVMKSRLFTIENSMPFLKKYSNWCASYYIYFPGFSVKRVTVSCMTRWPKFWRFTAL